MYVFLVFVIVFVCLQLVNELSGFFCLFIFLDSYMRTVIHCFWSRRYHWTRQYIIHTVFKYSNIFICTVTLFADPILFPCSTIQCADGHQCKVHNGAPYCDPDCNLNNGGCTPEETCSIDNPICFELPCPSIRTCTPKCPPTCTLDYCRANEWKVPCSQ